MTKFSRTELNGLPTTKQQKTLIKEFDDAPLELGAQMYLLCARWWQSWQEWVQYQSMDIEDAFATSDAALGLDPPGQIMNDHLLEQEEAVKPRKLKASLLEQKDYIIVPATTWAKLIEWYGGGPAIVRYVVGRGQIQQLMVEVYPLVLSVVRDTDLNMTVDFSFSQQATLRDLKKQLCAYFELKESDCQLWDYYQSAKYKKLENLDTALDACNMLPGQKVLLEAKVDGKYPMERASEECTSAPLPFISGSNSTLRLALVSNVQDDVTLNPSHASRRKGHAGLQNLGNTCFMNSALQCLSHTPPLSEYFLAGKHSMELNKDNLLGLGGELAEAFGSLMQALWEDTAACVTPRSFKSKLARFAPQFSGYNQQDSQELLAFLLDGLHEDLNRVKEKPYIEQKDMEEREESEVAYEAWQYHLARNNSVIVDLFQGQYKSTLVCPECSKTSVTFDPFMYLSLSLPVTTRNMKFSVFTSDGSAPPMIYGVKVGKVGKVAQVLAALSEVIELRDDERLVLTEVFHNYVYRICHTDLSVSNLKEMETFHAYRLPRIINGSSDVRDVVLVHRKQSTPGGAWVTFGGPVLISLPGTTPYGGPAAHAAVERGLEQALRPCKRNGTEPLGQAHPQGGNDVDMTNNSSQGPSFNNLWANFHRTPMTRSSTAARASMESSDDSCAASSNMYDLKKTNNRSSSVGPLYRLDPVADGEAASSGVEVNARSQSWNSAPTSASSQPTHPVEFLLVDWSAQAVGSAGMVDLECLGEPREKHSSAEPGHEGAITLEKCIEGFLQQEPLGPDDMWYCPRCKEHRQATKQLELFRLPQVLVVHLKRFSFSRIWRDKLDAHVQYPLHLLDLQKYVNSRGGPPAQYELFAVSNHYGGMGGGHYTAYAKQTDDNQWYCFDDSTVSLANPADVCSAAGYVLFYWRKDAARSSFADPVEAMDI